MRSFRFPFVGLSRPRLAILPGLARALRHRIALLTIAAIPVLGIAPLEAATLRGTIFDATGILDLQVGSDRFDLTFHDAGSGSWYDSFSTTDVTPAITAVSTEKLARSILGALQDFILPMGPIQVNNGQDFLVLPFASDGEDIRYMTTAVGQYNGGGVYGSFSTDAVKGDFYRSVSFVTVQKSRNATAAPAFAPTPVPGPGAGIALLGALGLGGMVLRRRRG